MCMRNIGNDTISLDRFFLPFFVTAGPFSDAPPALSKK